jgi:NADH-quinone oxidoreductase subunit E
MVISPEMRARIDAEIARFPKKRGALLAALHWVQKEQGRIAPEAAAALGEIFEIRPIEVMEVVTFYNMYTAEKQGRHQVRVCTNLPCSLRGARQLVHALEQHLGIEAGETTPDGRITLGHEECLGACAWAPMMRVDETYHEDLDVDKARQIVDSLK